MTIRAMRLTIATALLVTVAGCGSVADNPAGDLRRFEPKSPLVLNPPEPLFTRTMFAAATLKTVEEEIDKCRGPVAVDLGSHRPVLVAEHDYCGGSEWIGELDVGDAVKLGGDGIDPGLYVAKEMKYERRGMTFVGDLPLGDVVLQTCVTKSYLVLVAMKKVAPA